MEVILEDLLSSRAPAKECMHMPHMVPPFSWGNAACHYDRFHLSTIMMRYPTGKSENM